MQGSGRLAGKTALITGAARGHGAAEARLFAAQGASVMLTDIVDASALAAELPNARFLHLDVSNEQQWQCAVDATVEAFGRIDVLVNNAGLILPSAPIESTSTADYLRTVHVNQLGVFLGMRSVLPAMKAHGGAIINISSTAGMRAVPGGVAYNASKWAVRGMTKVAALEFARYGIRVNSVHPGLIRSQMIEEIGEEGIRERVSGLLTGRMGEPEEVAAMVLFIAADATFSTGSEFICDGGVLTGPMPR